MNKIILLSLALVALFAVTLYVSEQSKVTDNHIYSYGYKYHYGYICARYLNRRCVVKVYLYVSHYYTRVCYYRYLRKGRRMRYVGKCRNVTLRSLKIR